jgi:catechol 2,3-dioxygenase-like lactoylglutathione lyase family enzyme
MLTMGVVALGVTDTERAVEFWRRALGYELRKPTRKATASASSTSATGSSEPGTPDHQVNGP